jgi:branched-chain amino acid transport system permease protein
MTNLQAAAHTAGVNNKKWAIGFSSVVGVIFLLNVFVLPNTNTQVQRFFNAWLSLNSLAEIMIWILMALGLNIIVGYAGLLDLGYVAFWALGGYVAGWLMSPFLSQHQIDFFV